MHSNSGQGQQRRCSGTSQQFVSAVLALSFFEEVAGSAQSEFKFRLIFPSGTSFLKRVTAAACALSTLWVAIHGSLSESPARHLPLSLHRPAQRHCSSYPTQLLKQQCQTSAHGLESKSSTHHEPSSALCQRNA